VALRHATSQASKANLLPVSRNPGRSDSGSKDLLELNLDGGLGFGPNALIFEIREQRRRKRMR
jgi:hypothetical protein